MVGQFKKAYLNRPVKIYIFSHPKCLAYQKNETHDPEKTQDSGTYGNPGPYEDPGPYGNPQPVLSFLWDTVFG